MSTLPHEIANRCVFLDLETKQTGEILKIGAYWQNKTFYREGKFNPRQALLELDSEMADAECLAGHNVMEHDWKALHEAAPDLRIVNIPVLDTLLLSPICFPENPYHHLVKDYKLVSESRNNPIEDSRLSEQLLGDEFNALAGILANDPTYFNALRFLITHETSGDTRQVYGFQWLFSAVSGIEIFPSDEIGLEAIRRTTAPFCCHEGLRQALNSIALPEARWGLAFVIAWLRVAGRDSVLPPWVRLKYQWALRFLALLRETPCTDPECLYCRATHNPETQLKNFFGFDSFRATPEAPDGSSLQRMIIAAGMRNESLLGILPTGGGKSICFQLPALVRSFRRGQLTLGARQFS